MKIAVNLPVGERFWNVIALTISLLVVVFYALILAIYSYNFPFYDDYIAVLEVVEKWLSSTDVSEKISVLFEQHNEHRILYIRLISLFDYYLRGSVHFTDLIWVGNVSLLVWLFLLFKSIDFFQNNLKYWVLIPVVLLVFQFQSWDNTFWSMASLANFGIHAWVALAIYGAVRSGKWAWLGTVFSTLMALGTIGSGLFLIPIVLAVWAVRMRFREIIFGSIFMILAVVGYFYGYHQPPNYPSIGYTIAHAHWGQLALFWASFLGSNFYHPAIPFVAPLVGGTGILWFLFLTYQKYFLKKTYLYAILAFLVLTAVVVALNRYGRGIEGAYPSRYRMNSSLFLALSFLTVVDWVATPLKKWVIGLGIIGTAGLYGVSVVVYLPRIENNKELRVADNWLYQHGLPIAGSYRLKDANDMLIKSVKEGLFLPPALPNLLSEQESLAKIEKGMKVSADTILQNKLVEYDIDWLKNVDNQIALRGWVKFNQPGVVLKEVWVVSGNKVAYSTLFQKRYDLFEKHHHVQYQDTGFLGVLPSGVSLHSPNRWYLVAVGSNGQRVILPPK